MMNYEEFKEITKEKFKGFLGDEFKGLEVVVRPVDKINCIWDGISIVNPKFNEYVSPTLYINALYKQYQKTEDLEGTLKTAADTMIQEMKKGNELHEKLDLDKAKENIIFQLINTKKNENLLSKVPHRQFLDLSIVYRWLVNEDEKGISSALIHDQLAEKLGMNEEELFEVALANTKRIMTPTIRTLYEVLFGAIGMSEEIPEDNQLYVISNQKNINGAGSILYEEKLHEVAEKIGTDLYILPSSVHEVIAVSAELGSPEALSEMVREISGTQVSEEEQLSDHVYFYDKEKRQVSMC